MDHKLSQLLAEGVQLLLHHHAHQDPVATPDSKSKATDVLEKIKYQLSHYPVTHDTPSDVETGKGPLPTS